MEVIKNGFKNERLGIELDVYVINGKEWFRAKDIANFVGYKATNDMTKYIVNKELHLNTINSRTEFGNNSNIILIDEYGIYECLLKVRQTNDGRFEKAREFQEWVFGEVLPSIRKNNFYVDKNNINQEQVNKLKEYLFDLCEDGKISLGKASLRIFGDEKELKKRLINLGWIDYDNCIVRKIVTKASNGKKYELFCYNVSGTYAQGVVKEQLQVSLTNAGYVYLKDLFEKDRDKGLVVKND